MENELHIRMATPDDAAALLAIYAPYILTTGITFEYDVPTEAAFRARIENILKRFPYLVAEKNGEILGYSYAGPLGERAAFSHSAETVIYVKNEAKGMKIGQKLYQKLEKLLKMQNITNLCACIAYRETEDETLTHASPKFHAKMGYKKVGHFTKCGYKFGRWYDLIWVEKFIGEHTACPADFIPIGNLKLD